MYILFLGFGKNGNTYADGREIPEMPAILAITRQLLGMDLQ